MSGVWVTDPNDWRLLSKGRGTPEDSFYNGGWRCAGAMGFHGEKTDHLVAAPFYDIRPEGDPRHSCYCKECAKEFFGVEP